MLKLLLLSMPGPAEWIIILVIALIIFGPGKLPDVGRGIGRAIREFRKASNGINDEINTAIEDKKS
ncbi:MAG TPA: twin-arginine translocase TatA/TatE family subunit [Candidatus Eremiobacteraeota bacterium]|nr:MAG: Sec-independent protein translocase protein TatAy [bacterium ADurb.Bin363]HPZ07307.1 twin-arginine translocase TatA/TatE family subunit [Candidatus Eremiobacteraeota bacterium]